LVVADSIAAGTGCLTRRFTVSCAWCDQPSDRLVGACSCGGPLETFVDADPAPAGVSGFYRDFWSVLPLNEQELPTLDLWTPVVEAPFVQRLVGGPPVYLKLEALLPTSSTKDRAAAVALPYLRQAGVTELVMSSTGNTSTAFAALMPHFPELTLHLFVGRDFAYRLANLNSGNIVAHLIDGNFVQAGMAGMAFAKERNLLWEGGFFTPGRRDGLKTAFIEASLQLGQTPEMYVQAVSSAMGVVGVAKAATELDGFGLTPSLPRLLCVQQRSCAPMVSAWQAGRGHITPGDKVSKPRGLAKAILRGDPSTVYPIIHRVVERGHGAFIAVDDREILAARRLIHRNLSLSICESSAAAIAGYLSWANRHGGHGVDGPVLINITGSDRNEIARRADRDPLSAG
jgi:threonine synthase